MARTGFNPTAAEIAAIQGVDASVLTVGTMSQGSAIMGSLWTKFSWTNTMVVALGASLTGDITVCTLPAKTQVLKALIVITGQATGVTTLTIGVGRTSALYIDYIVASDAKAAVNTIYGDGFAELGTNLSALVGDLPSLTATTAIKAHFISTVSNLNAVTGSSGDIYLQTVTLP